MSATLTVSLATIMPDVAMLADDPSRIDLHTTLTNPWRAVTIKPENAVDIDLIYINGKKWEVPLKEIILAAISITERDKYKLPVVWGGGLAIWQGKQNNRPDHYPCCGEKNFGAGAGSTNWKYIYQDKNGYVPNSQIQLGTDLVHKLGKFS